MFNHIAVLGRMSRDPEMRTTQTGLQVVNFTLACDRDYKDKDTGERVCDWIDCVAFRNQAQFVCNYMGKGCLALVEGRLQIRDWTDRDGNKRRSAEILVDNVYFGDSKRPDSKPQQQAQPQYAPRDGGFAEIENARDDLPF